MDWIGLQEKETLIPEVKKNKSGSARESGGVMAIFATLHYADCVLIRMCSFTLIACCSLK